jgi:hypothetical protein
MALNVLGSQFDKLLNVTLCYPENHTRPFYDMLSGRLTRIVVRINLVPIGEELHGDYVNDKNFKRGFQRWLNGLWEEKDRQLTDIMRDKEGSHGKVDKKRRSVTGFFYFFSTSCFTVSAY